MNKGLERDEKLYINMYLIPLLQGDLFIHTFHTLKI